MRRLVSDTLVIAERNPQHGIHLRQVAGPHRRLLELDVWRMAFEIAQSPDGAFPGRFAGTGHVASILLIRALPQPFPARSLQTMPARR